MIVLAVLICVAHAPKRQLALQGFCTVILSQD
jgi:hypothetical protein